MKPRYSQAPGPKQSPGAAGPKAPGSEEDEEAGDHATATHCVINEFVGAKEPFLTSASVARPRDACPRPAGQAAVGTTGTVLLCGFSIPALGAWGSPQGLTHHCPLLWEPGSAWRGVAQTITRSLCSLARPLQAQGVPAVLTGPSSEPS